MKLVLAHPLRDWWLRLLKFAAPLREVRRLPQSARTRLRRTTVFFELP